MIAAVLLYTEQGWNVRLTDCGGHISTLTVPAPAGEAPTAEATRALNEHGWTVVEQWTPASPDGWIAYVEYQPDQVPAWPQPGISRWTAPRNPHPRHKG